MPLVFMDSFDHYGSADIATKWPLTVGAAVIQAGAGRRGTNSLRCASNGQTIARLFTPGPTWIVGMSVRFDTLHTNPSPLLDWADGTTVQAQVRVTGTGQIQLCRSAPGGPGGSLLLATSTVAMGFNTTYYLEWLLTVNGSSGVSTVRLDGIPVVSVSSANTQVTASALANRLRIGNSEGILALGNLDLDDLYVCTNQTAFLGDCRVDYLPPSGDGTHRAWTPSAGTTHYTLVDDLAPNGDTDYLASITPGNRESHTFPTLPSMPNPVIRGVQHCINARKDDAGTRQLRSLVLSGATTQVGATIHTLALSYVSYQELWETDPNTGAAWTTAAVNAIEAGIETQ